MRKILILVVCLLVVACGKYDYSIHMTEEEKLILNKFDERGYCEGGRDILNNFVGSQRQEKPIIVGKPFCDVPMAMNSAETYDCQLPQLSKGVIEAYRSVVGRDYADHCGFKRETPKYKGKYKEAIGAEPKDVDTYKKNGDEVVDVLSLDKYDEMLHAVKTCNRAKQRMITITSSGNELTVVHYDEIMTLLHKCKQYELEKAMQH